MGIIMLPNGTGGFNMIPTADGSSSVSRCPNCDKIEDTRTVCNHCDHVYKEEDNEKTSLFGIITLGIVALIIVGIILFLVDDAVLGSKYFNKIHYGADCSFDVPSGYTVVYNEKDKLYAVKVDNGSEEYLYNGGWRIEKMYASIAKPSLFDSECDAKGYLKAFLKQSEPKISNYK